MKITKRQLRKFIRETAGTLSEDRIADELEHLRKNIKDDEEHIDNLESDIEQEREEEGRAKKARRTKKDESTSFSVLHLLEGEMRESEMREFSRSKSGKKVESAGRKILAAGSTIGQVAEDQTGKMRETLHRVSEFVQKVGASLGGLGTLEEGYSVTENLPSVQELKQLIKDIQKLEK